MLNIVKNVMYSFAIPNFFYFCAINNSIHTIMKRFTISMATFLTVIGLNLTSCSSDEPTPTIEPDQPETPSHPQKDWKGEKAHGFLLNVDNLSIPVSERGFLQHYERDNSGKLVMTDEVVIEATQNFKTEKTMTSSYPVTGFNLTCDGTLADPFENTEAYVTACTELGFRPKSQFSEFAELMQLPAPEMNRVFLLDQVTDIELITEKDFDAQHQANTSMRSYDVDGPGAGIWVMPGSSIFDSWKRGRSLDGISGPGYVLPISKCDAQWSTYPDAQMQLYFFGYPDKAGEYPMTLRMTFAKSGTKEFKFTVKFVSK